MKKVLEGERIYLRPFTNEDSELYYVSLLDKEMRRLTGTKKIFSKNMIEKHIARIAEDDERIDLLIVLKEEDKVIGDIALLDIDLNNRNAHMRIALFNDEECSKGYGTEAMRILLNYGFGSLNLHRVELNVYSFNPRAIKAYEKLGFVKEGVQRDILFYDHEYHDAITMSILEDEFK
ncbi:GNAT family N-acetyltransferase [Paenibacillus pini]|uniref:Aminoglycoside N6'-acetyltransferase n=1 Tax=Paenibacillus pini JCM 16418 TaxID=1236976 RepID=W7YUJ3_9BACL|nr:GNAT family protein [Paenibacillus pini]GAF06109.1 aminoglycoside N6'-acetyltransferase [Paenibacillus pini JCM 16418]